MRPVRIATAAALLAAIGCSDSGPKLADVEGVVTVDGRPMGYVGVVFHPPVGPIATGNTNAEGRFTLTTANRSGALVGDHVVTIADSSSGVKYEATEDRLLGAPVRGSGASSRRRFSERYASSSTSDLRVTVESGKDNEFAFELEKD